MTKVVNIDDLIDPPKLVVVIDGEDHAMKEAELRDTIFLFNSIEELSAEPSLLREIELMAEMIDRFFPTIGRERINGLSMGQITRLFDLLRNGGEKADAPAAEGDADQGKPQAEG